MISTEAALSFLGVGVRPPTPSWGQMIAEAVAYYFVIFYLLPADPAAAACGKTCSPERLAEVRHFMGLDQPVRRQFGDYLVGIFAGPELGSGPHALQCGFPCLGYSYENALPVWDLLMDRLPVSVQAQVVNLMESLGGQLGLSFLFIAHDLSVVKRVCDRVAVMCLGRIVEIGDKRELYDRPAHPYTRALLSAVPLPDPAAGRCRERILLLGDPPSPAAPPSGCGFHPRCPKAQAVCRTERPLLQVVGSGARTAACHFPETG